MPSSASFDCDPLAVVLAFDRAAQVTESGLALAGPRSHRSRCPMRWNAVRALLKQYGRNAAKVDLLWPDRMLRAGLGAADAGVSRRGRVHELSRKPAGEHDAPIRDSRRDDEGPSSSAGF